MFIKCLLLLLAAGFLSAGLVPSPENRIIGGRDIRIEEAPWQVLIAVEKSVRCGGSIYSKDIIITAAHCLHRPGTKILLEAKNFLVFVGSELRDSRVIPVKVAAIKANENFTLFRPAHAYDIGIMKLAKPLEFNRKVQPISLATKEPAPGSLAWSTGWGLTDRRDHTGSLNPPRILQGVEIPIQNWKTCKKSLEWVPKGAICAGAAGKSACKGDSGGPLVVNRKLVGVVSGGGSICSNSGIYANVVLSRQWILDTIKRLA